MARQCQPKQQPTEVLDYIASRYTVDSIEGVVLNAKGESVGKPGSDGYYRLTVYPFGWKKPVTLRRVHVIWFLVTGDWPEAEIDHKNRHKTDDRFDNLVISNRSLQQGNRATSDRDLPVGVHYKPRMKTNPYLAQIHKDNQTHYLGFFPTPGQASQAYQKAQKEMYT